MTYLFVLKRFLEQPSFENRAHWKKAMSPNQLANLQCYWSLLTKKGIKVADDSELLLSSDELRAWVLKRFASRHGAGEYSVSKREKGHWGKESMLMVVFTEKDIVDVMRARRLPPGMTAHLPRKPQVIEEETPQSIEDIMFGD